MAEADPIYLDYNATTPLLPEVVEAMLPYLRTTFGNPSSGHWYGQRAKAAVDRAREQVALLLGCSPDEVLFTSGGTEASNLAIHGIIQSAEGRNEVVTTAIEHPATEAPCAWLEENGHRVHRVAPDSHGRARIDEAKAAIGPRTALVTVMHANNETGVLQPIAELVERAKAADAIVHTDAAQTVGKIPVDVNALGVDLMSIAGHKLYAPKGVGALYVRRGTLLYPFMRGAGHERGLRPGTENVASIVGLGAACEAVNRDLTAAAERMRVLRDILWAQLSARVPGVQLNGHPELRLPNTLNVRFPAASGPALLAATPEVAASTGSACHAGRDSASAVILAMGVDPVEALGSVRLSLGRQTTEDELGRAADALALAHAAMS